MNQDLSQANEVFFLSICQSRNSIVILLLLDCMIYDYINKEPTGGTILRLTEALGKLHFKTQC